MYIVGVDIAKRSHEAVVIDTEGNIVKKAFNFKNNSEGFRKFLSILEKIGQPSEFIIRIYYWNGIHQPLLACSFLTIGKKGI